MENDVTKLFVYGSLRSGFQSPAFEYISKHFTFISKGKVKGRLYDLGDYPAAIPASEDDFIIGELYDLKKTGEFEWAIEQLDDYEGLNPEQDDLPMYKRELTEVLYNDKCCEAWIYWYNGDISNKSIIASGDIFAYPPYKSKS